MFKKLFFSFSLVIVGISVAMTIAISRYADGILSQDILDSYQVSAQSILSQCNRYILQLQNELLTAAVDPDLQESIQGFALGQTSVIRRSGHSPAAVQVFPIHDGMLCSPDEKEVYRQDAVLTAEAWVQDTIQKDGCLNMAAVDAGEKQNICFSMLLTDIPGWASPIAVLAMDVSLDSFVLNIGKTILSASDRMMLVDSYGQVQYPYQQSDPSLSEKLQAARADGYYMDSDYIYFSSPIIRSSWQLVLSYSTQNVHARTKAVYSSIIQIAILAVILSCIVAGLFSYQHSIPIINLAQHIKCGPFQRPIELPKGLSRDYLTLYNNYNSMTDQMNSLLDELYEVNRRERETQLKMLQAQLNPHFIYNVLDSINWMARKYNAQDVQMMVSSLATMLRCSLNSGRDIISVQQEIKQIQSYLDIQSYRYDNTISVSYDFSIGIMEKRMLKLLLQPLVENAIIHGLEPYDGPKSLRLSGRLENDLLVFEVANNGILPDLDRLEQILSGSQQVTTSYGIRNVNERIQAAYGTVYGLRYYIRDEWLIANITVPTDLI